MYKFSLLHNSIKSIRVLFCFVHVRLIHYNIDSYYSNCNKHCVIFNQVCCFVFSFLVAVVMFCTNLQIACSCNIAILQHHVWHLKKMSLNYPVLLKFSPVVVLKSRILGGVFISSVPYIHLFS